jgi:hypothetical protein
VNSNSTGEFQIQRHLQLATLPSLVTVHGIVSANNCSDLTSANFLSRLEELFQVTGSALRVSIAAITKEVNEDLGDTNLLGELEQCIEVSLLGVDSTMADKTLSWCKIDKLAPQLLQLPDLGRY